MDEDTYDAISVMIDQKELVENKNKYQSIEGGNIDMCKAMQDWAKELKQEGRTEGIRAIIEVCKELGATNEETRTKIIEKFLFSDQEAQSFLDQYWR